MTGLVRGSCARSLLFALAVGCAGGSGEQGTDDTSTGGDSASAATTASAATSTRGGTSSSGTTWGSSGGASSTFGPVAEGWGRDFVEGGVGIACGQSEAEMQVAGAPSLTFGASTIYVGFEQDGQNQDPVFARFDDGIEVYCEHHEAEAPDGRALGLTWNGGEHVYVVYTIVGGGSSLEGKGGWLSSYAPGSISGGGAKVSVLGRVEADTGGMLTASFVIAVKSDNKVNAHSPRAAPSVLDSGDVEFLGASAHKPIDADGKASMVCTDDPFDSRYVFSPDLSTLICASCSNCASQQACDP